MPAVALSLGCGLQAHAATLRVPGQYPTIQQAIDASRSGDVVLVAPGTYFESLSIFGKGDLALESEAGPSRTIIDGRGASFVICVAPSSLTCGQPAAGGAPEEAGEDRSIAEGATPADASADGASAPPKREHTTRIAGFTIRHGQDGIFVRHCRAEIQDNILTGIGKDHQIYIYGAIYATGASGTIRRDLVEDDYLGIFASRPRDLRIEDNVVVRNAWTGIRIMNSDSVERRIILMRNVVSRNMSRGLHIIGSLDIRAEDNLVVDNGSSGTDSVLFVAQDGEGNSLPISGRFVNNTVAGPGSSYWVVGFAGDVTGLEFANNVVYSQGNQPAINCYSFDSKTKFHHDDTFSVGSVGVPSNSAHGRSGG